MKRSGRPLLAALAAVVALGAVSTGAQTHGVKERFVAVAIANDEFGSGADRVIIDVTRWSTEAERTQLVTTLREKGSRSLLDALADMKSVGTIRTPDSLAYDLRYAQQTRDEEGGRRIILATDRPVGFWETVANARTLDYPFTVIQMQLDRDGKGRGTLSLETKIRAYGNIIEAENYATAPIQLTEIEVSRLD